MASSELPLKYYVYISDTKLDMLAAGIPTPLRKKIIAELSLDLQVVKVSLKERPSEETRYSKLLLVTKYIDDKLKVGTVDEPRAYFRGAMQMRWGAFEDESGRSDELVFFGASTDRTIVGLGGSMRHVIGEVGASQAHSNSATPVMLHALRKGLGSEASRLSVRGDSQTLALLAVDLASTSMPGPAEPLEFLARKLLAGSTSSTDRLVVLGTPIYVARADD